MFSTQSVILDNKQEISDYYSDFSIKKERFVLKTKIIKKQNIDFITFIVFDTIDDAIVYDSYQKNNQYKWRAIDFDGIGFSDTSLDIIVKSNDIGTIIFTYDGNSWFPD